LGAADHIALTPVCASAAEYDINIVIKESEEFWFLIIVLRPHAPKDIRGGWLHYTATSKPVDGNGAQNMVKKKKKKKKKKNKKNKNKKKKNKKNKKHDKHDNLVHHGQPVNAVSHQYACLGQKK
jgi:hypothetical protein